MIKEKYNQTKDEKRVPRNTQGHPELKAQKNSTVFSCKKIECMENKFLRHVV
jgi:hypothetical protein